MRKTKSLPPSTAGYTLLELLVVLGIIALLIALVAPSVVRYLGDARSQTAQTQLKNVESALELYFLDTGGYPPTDQGLTALVTKPAAATKWNGPYLKSLTGLNDPWGKPFLYKSPGDATPFELASLGRDGKPGGDGEDRDLKVGAK